MGNVMLKQREADKPEDKVSLTVHEPVTATFALRYLVNFAKAAPLSGVVELGLGPDAPLLVKFDLERQTTDTCNFIWPQRLTSDQHGQLGFASLFCSGEGAVVCKQL